MKRPLGPWAPPSSEPNALADGEDCDRASSGGAQRAKKRRGCTVCELCDIRLNSAAQAQIHYKGKSHQRRLKQNSRGGNNAGTSGQSGPLVTPLPVTGRPLQPQLDLKHLLPFRLNGSSPLSLFPNFNTMDPVQKAVINHTFGVPQPLKKKQIISCNICHLRFNSTNQAEAHYKGHKHARKLKAAEAQKNRQRRSGEAPSGGRERDGTKTSELALVDSGSEDGTCLRSDPEASFPDVEIEEESPGSSAALTPVPGEAIVEPAAASPTSSQFADPISNADATDAPESAEAGGADACDADGEARTDEEGKKSKAHLHCPVCKVTVNSASQLEAHNSGTKHKLMLEGQSVLPRRRGKMAAIRAGCKSKRLASKSSLGVSAKSFQCEVCEISLNSETQLSQHMNSRRHKDRMAGKPPKPKFSPHSKSQQPSLANMRWSGCAGAAVSAMKKALGQYSLTSLSSQTKLALQKQLSKSLSAGFLPGPLTPPTLCTVATNPLALRHPLGAASAAFIQTPFLGPALFRPAPGPLRAAHAPIIFSPY
ncbi:zinc finger protein 385C isoform X1 [Corythoichthys intestinalis]|uniref:zinc finger protein 385C isoform X1 n=1 Tax=Corythoichthys intestinalis TaxID=161448 RepID=UPI0025A64BCF|nr:zinc finger protein 385C isoform X1 [Corythoichthys intestinalis]XP_057716685.1 zinc finger protein 385C isoform X1 [Corythoichthys intestinalis]XP_057716686.1 zinc finger protein 385C isoform X1 [Corythoichthys intestinalis]XP_057716687.1 zinc finger protein 385C isoform X1 [Corythoichthys intestinalis]